MSINIFNNVIEKLNFMQTRIMHMTLTVKWILPFFSDRKREPAYCILDLVSKCATTQAVECHSG